MYNNAMGRHKKYMINACRTPKRANKYVTHCTSNDFDIVTWRDWFGYFPINIDFGNIEHVCLTSYRSYIFPMIILNHGSINKPGSTNEPAWFIYMEVSSDLAVEPGLMTPLFIDTRLNRDVSFRFALRPYSLCTHYRPITFLWTAEGVLR